MSFGAIFNKYRQVIPRWHTYPMARWLGVTVSATFEGEKFTLDENYYERIRSWEKSGKLTHASDLVGNALVLNSFDDERVIKAAEFILKNRKRATGLLLELAETYLRLARKETFPLPDVIIPEEVKRFYGVIANLKARTREYPRNPVLWMDLAFYYSVLGKTKAADNAVKIALSLNSENRYLLRSGARFFMHSGDSDAALYYLRRSNIGRHDPWLVAAEIAISDTLDVPSQRIKAAKGLIESDSIPKFHLSELASALGTIELNNGATKKGRKLFSLALEKPTENTLAQATFVQSMLGSHRDKIRPDELPQSFEAKSRVHFQKGDFTAALEDAKNWLAYQPFSSMPAAYGSYIASVALGRFEEAIKIAKIGQLSSPRDFMLKNNHAFSLASLGRPEEAREILAYVVESALSESDKSVLNATRGTIEFRSGNINEGRKLYESAVTYFKQSKDYRSEAIAEFFWAREENIVAKSDIAKQLKEAALAKAKSLKLNELIPPSKDIK